MCPTFVRWFWKLRSLLTRMDINEWVKRTDLSSPITEGAVLLTGRDGILPTRAIGSGVFVADRLIMTVKHVLQGYWDIYGNPNVVLERFGKKMAPFEMFAIQVPRNSTVPAMWAASKVSICPYSRSCPHQRCTGRRTSESTKVIERLKAPIINIFTTGEGRDDCSFWIRLNAYCERGRVASCCK